MVTYGMKILDEYGTILQNSQYQISNTSEFEKTFKTHVFVHLKKLEWQVFDHILEVVLVELWSEMLAPPIIS